MWFFIPSLLLVAVFWQPWTHLQVPGHDALAQEYHAAFDTSLTAPQERSDLRHLKVGATRELALARAEAERLAAEQAAQAAVDQAAAQQAAAQQARVLEAAQAPQPAPYTGDLEDLICSYAWPCSEALAVAYCESTMQPGVTNGTSYGLFQINGIHASRFPGFWETWTDAAVNTSWAYQIWSAQGWYPWSCRPYY